MGKKATFTLLCIFFMAVVLYGVVNWSSIFNQDNMRFKEENPTNIMRVEAKGYQPGDLLYEVVLLEELEGDTSKEANEKLFDLAKRRDAVGYKANLILAERHQEKEEAAAYYRQALDLHETKEVRSTLAYFFVKKGDFSEAIKEYIKLLPDEGAIQALTNLNADPITIGKALIEGNHWKAAIDYLESLLEQEKNGDDKIEIQKQYSRALAGLGEYRKALPILEAMAMEGLLEEELQWWYARCLEALGQKKKAEEQYQNLGERGAYRLGILFEQEGKLQQAAEAFSQSDTAAALWRGGKLWEQLGRQDRALENYVRLAGGASVYQDDVAYRAYLLITRNGGQGADEMLEILSKYPAWMKRLGKKPIFEMISDPPYGKPEFLKRVEVYRESGRQEMAEIELAIGEKIANLMEKLALGDWYLEQGQYSTAARWGIRALHEQPCRRAYELAYLRPFEDTVQRAASQYRLDPNLIWAVMREESCFQSDAVSRAGALGLMQIMPATGKDIASRLKMTITEKDLLEPEVNIIFGAFYLRSMLNMFSEDLDKALAAYNGGPGNVRRWSGSKLYKTPEDFPITIAFLETQEYITKVSNSYYIYQWLYGNE